MAALKNILLVDDDTTTNFFNKYLLENHPIEIGEIYEAFNGQEALDKLKELHKEGTSIDLILLDINMPIMDGFEFLDEYEKLDEAIKSKIVVCMLTSSSHGKDLEKAKEFDSVNYYLEKALTNEKIDEITDKFFDK